MSSKEAVIFEQIGQLAGVTAYLHVHIELSITSVEQQLDKYQQLLVTKLGTEESIATFMLGLRLLNCQGQLHFMEEDRRPSPPQHQQYRAPHFISPERSSSPPWPRSGSGSCQEPFGPSAS